MKNFRNRALFACAVIAVLVTASSCALDPASDEDLGADVDVTTQAIGEGQAFNSIFDLSCQRNGPCNTPGIVRTEAFTECPTNFFVFGFGARVDSKGNFTGVKLGCGSADYVVTRSGAGEEKIVSADPGQVVVGVGGIVTGNDLTRAVIRQCPFNFESHRVATGELCSLKSEPFGSSSTELFLDSHFGVADPSNRVVVGVGLTASGDNLATIRVEVGTLK